MPTAKTGQIQVTCVLPVEVVGQLDTLAQEQGVSRAALIRLLIHQGLGTEESSYLFSESLYRLSSVLQRAQARLTREILATLPAVLREELGGEG